MQELPADAPVTAKHLYFRDAIGNVSTSAVRKSLQQVRAVPPTSSSHILCRSIRDVHATSHATLRGCRTASAYPANCCHIS